MRPMKKRRDGTPLDPAHNTSRYCELIPHKHFPIALPMNTEKPPSGPGASENTADSTGFFYVGMSLFLMLTAVLGFWPSYFGPLLQGGEMTMRLPTNIQSWVIHLHAALFMGWFAILFVQTILIARKRPRVHMALGHWGVALGGFVVGGALLVVVLRTNILVSEMGITLSSTPAINSGIVLQPIIFSILLFFGYTNRRSPEAHKRYMLFATISIMPAATDRMFYVLGEWSMQIMFVVFISSVVAYDYLTRGYVHRSSLIGIGLLLINVVVFSLPFSHGG